MQEEIVKINNIPHIPVDGVNYKYDYGEVVAKIKEKTYDEISIFRQLILDDLFFILKFIMCIPTVDRTFVVEACREVEEETEGWTLDLWARLHFKSSVITKARTIQRVLRDPEKCHMIVSHTRPMAKKFLRPIMFEFESNDFLKTCFPDILYDNPRGQAPKWSEDDGIIVKRNSRSRGEATVEAWGIKEGMPISVHFDDIVLDDLETKDDVRNPDMVHKVREAVELCFDLLTEDGTMSVVGTPYSHEGVYIPFIRDMKKAEGKPAFLYRRKPATADGTPTGKPVLVTREKLANIRAKKGEYTFNCQQLINPTPVASRSLDGSLISDINPHFIPKTCLKFMPIDPAGDMGDDSWAFAVIGVEPKSDDLGASNIYIYDLVISSLGETEAIEEITRMYMRNGLIMQVGVEKVGLSTTEIHVKNALAKRGRHISIIGQTLFILTPAGRSKIKRIESALAWPLYNSKIHISTSVPEVYRDRLREEMDKFPYWHDDGLDILSYLYDMIKKYQFAWYDDEEEEPEKVSQKGRSEITRY